MQEPSDIRAKRNVAYLVAAQAFLGSQMPMYFVVGGLAGQQLAPNPCLATLAITAIVFGSMLTAPWISPFMQRHGRRAGFILGTLGGMLGAGVSALGLYLENFWIFAGGGLLIGIYMSAQGFYRFAATDTASAAYRPKAISYVMAGGLVSAIIGPQLVTYLSGSSPDATAMRFFPVYIAAMVLNFVGLFLFFGLDIPKPKAVSADTGGGRTRWQLITNPTILVSVICAAVSYALMNLVMTSTPLAVVGCGFGVPDASNVVTSHVLAMFVPSFFTGHLIARYGAEKIMGIGLAILACGGAVALSGITLTHFFAALMLLGVGWNFGFIGATALLTSAHTEQERGRMQGLNDLIVFGSVTVASLTSGGLMNCSGSSAIEGWTSVNLAMAPFLTLAGGALIWLVLRKRVAQPSL